MARFIFHPERSIRQYESISHLGDVWYNLKTNPIVGKVLEEKTKVQFTITGLGNLKRLNDWSKGIFLVQGETQSELNEIYDKGIGGFIVDNEREFNFVKEFSREIPIFIRIKAKEHTIYTGKYFVYGVEWSKISRLIGSLDGKFGVHFHRKTQNVGEWALIDDFSEIVSALESKIQFFNIGGGLPFPYHNSRPNLKPIFKRIERFKEFLKDRGLNLVLEPGRYISAPSMDLETTVLNKYDNNLIIDASLYNAYIDTLLFGIRLDIENETKKGHTYTIKGRSPDSLDIFRYKACFKEEKKIGDKILFLNAGAYNFHTDFSDLPRIPTDI
jgi:ornithine decarboxylase